MTIKLTATKTLADNVSVSADKAAVAAQLKYELFGILPK